MDHAGRARDLTIDHRYVLLRSLSQSPRSRVFLARDLRAPGEPVVVKTTPAPTPSSDTRALEPYADLAALNHRNIIPVRDLGRVRHLDQSPESEPAGGTVLSTESHPDLDEIYLVFPYLAGGDLAGAAREFWRSGPPDEAAVDRWITGVSLQILAGLRALHDRARLHYDVKPEHILVAGESELAPGIPRLVLIDLGLSDRASTPLGTRVRGTPPFMAPEILRSSLVDHRVDLYSFGATLHFALRGSTSDEPPSADLGSWPPLDDATVPHLPKFWADLITRLLSDDAERRPSSAAAVIDELRARPAAEGLELPLHARWPIEHCLGQEREFDYVARELEKLRVGDQGNAVVLLSGEEGVGRRAVSRRLTDLARLQGIEVLGTRVGSPTDTPWSPLVRVLTQIRELPDASAELRAAIDPVAHSLRSGGTWDPTSFPPLRERSLEQRRILGRLGSIFASLPTTASYLIVFEELHRAAPELIEAIGIASRRVSPSSEGPNETAEPTTGGNALFLATVDDTTGSTLRWSVRARTLELDRLAIQPHVARVSLKPLNVRRAGDLVRDVLGPCHLSSATLHALHSHAGGMSRALLALLRECQDYGYLVRAAHGWEWSGPDPVHLDSVHEERQRRAASLPPLSRRALELLALLGGTAEETHFLDLLREVSDPPIDDENNPTRALSTLVEDGWIDRRVVTGQLSLVRQLPDESENAALFAALAHALLRRGPEFTVPSTRLFARAGENDEVARLLGAATRSLLDTHADASLAILGDALLDLGIPLTDEVGSQVGIALLDLGLEDRALDLLEDVEDSSNAVGERIRAAVMIARIARKRGAFSRARKKLEAAWERAIQLESEEELRLEVLLETAEVEAAEGFLDAAIETAQRADELAIGETHRADEIVVVHARIRLFLHEAYVQQSLSERAQRAIQHFLDAHAEGLSDSWRARLLDRLALFAFRHGQYDRALALWGETRQLSEELGDTLSLADALANLGRVHTNRGEVDLATQYYQQTLNCLTELDHRHGIAVTHNNIGLVFKIRNLPDEAIACFRRALAIWEDLGEHDPFRATALNNLSEMLTFRGDYALALEHSLRALEIRKRLENPADIAFSYYRLAKIYQAQGELDRSADYAEKSLEIRRQLGDKNSLAYSLLALGELHLARGKYFEAFRCFRQSQSNFESIGNPLGRAILLLAFSHAYRDVGAFEEAIDAARQAPELSEDVTAGEVAAALGSIRVAAKDLSAAESDLAEAEPTMRTQGSRRDLARVLLDKAQLTLEIGQRERSESALAEAYTHIEELGLRDLSPTYYRLRGTALIRQPRPDLKVAEKLIERGLEEARQLDLPEETWRCLIASAEIAQQLDQTIEARTRAGEALEILRELESRVPTPYDTRYLDAPDRKEALREWDVVAEDGTPPEEPPTELPSAHLAPTERPRTNEPLTQDLMRLQGITLLLATERNPETLLERILDAVLDLFQAERGFLILIEGDEHEIRAARNLDREEVDRPEFKYSQSIAREVAQTGRVFLTNDAQNDDRLADKQSVHDLRLQAIACFPLESLGRRMGVIYLENRFRKQLVPDDKVVLLEAFSSQAAVALANAQLIAENLARHEELEESKAKIEELNDALSVRVEEQSRQLEVAQLEIRRQQDQLEDRFQFHNIIGACPQMQHLYRLLDRVAATDLPVLIEGESGTGKELVARALHYHAMNQRSDKPFVSENCGAVAETLFESELFGHVRGSFTGADQDRSGLFALAEEGTLFLDEVHELTLPMQRKLLRVLQENEYRPVGSTEFLATDVRLLTACNEPLASLVKDGRFREDLYYRLNVIKIELPPLRERGNDVILLAKHFLDRIVEQESLEPKQLSSEALRALLSHEFPGNVRELRNMVEKAAVLTPGPVIAPDDLFLGDGTAGEGAAVSEGQRLVDLELKEAKETFVHQYLQELLRRNDDVVARAARAAGVTRESLHRLLKKHGLR